ncbi:HNH endonuclease [Tumidithrix helvetica]|uniref:HNH endonuclease n=1 Tax=Tumidithrix helvetica TaxID=3457545 RepID=UPI003CC6363C
MSLKIEGEVVPVVDLQLGKQQSVYKDESNLALACRSCNLRKGTRISGIDLDSSSESHSRMNYPVHKRTG